MEREKGCIVSSELGGYGRYIVDEEPTLSPKPPFDLTRLISKSSSTKPCGNTRYKLLCNAFGCCCFLVGAAGFVARRDPRLPSPTPSSSASRRVLSSSSSASLLFSHLLHNLFASHSPILDPLRLPATEDRPIRRPV